MDARRRRAPRLTTVSAACESCRKHHVKCDGERPTCTPCQIRGSTCVFATARSSETHSQALKRKFAELQIRHDTFVDLFQLLQNVELGKASGALSLLRSGADAASIARYLRGGDLHQQQILRADSSMRFAFPYIDAMPPDILACSPNPYSEAIIFKATLGALPSSSSAGNATSSRVDTAFEQPYCVPFQHVQLVEPTLDFARPERWSSVPVSPAAAQRLLRIYFLRDYPYFTFFHKDLFLEDMRNGHNRFCSSLLVNAVLAYACHGDGELKGRADFWQPQSLCYQLTAEARRLWELESMDPSVTVVQAGMVLSAISNIDGLDRVGWKYLCDTCDMARELSLFEFSAADTSDPINLNRLVTAWSLYGWQGLCALNLRKAPCINGISSVTLPSGADLTSIFGEVWVLYPSAPHPVPLSHGVTFCALASFRALLCDLACINAASASSSSSVQLHLLLSLRSRLQDWVLALPEPVQAERIVYPSHLKMHAHFHHTVAAVLEGILVSTRADTEYATQSLDITDGIARSELLVECLIRLYYLRHSYEAWDNMLIQFFASVGSKNLVKVQSSESHFVEHRTAMSSVLLCSKGMFQQSKHIYLSEVLFRLHRHAMGRELSYLLQHFGDDTGEDEQSSQRVLAMSQHVRSAWPLDDLGAAMKSTMSDVDELIVAATVSDLPASCEQ